MDPNRSDPLPASENLPSSTAGMETGGTLTRLPSTNIFSLPPELLVMIFRNLTSPEYNGWSDYKFEPFHSEVRLVCHQWLNLIDSTPVLWTRLVLRTPVADFDRLRVILQRSGDAPLDLTVTLSSMSEQLFSLLLPEIGRVWSLKLDGTSWERYQQFGTQAATFDEKGEALRNLMQQFIMAPAPLLEDLAIRTLNITADAFSCTTPSRLQYLQLENCTHVSPTSCIFHSTELNALTIDACQIWESLDGLADLLRTLPKLQYMLLQSLFCTRPFDNSNNIAHNSVHLPDLQHIDLYLPIDTAALLVSIFDLPSSTELDIKCFLSDTPDLNIEALTSSMDMLTSTLDSHFKKLFPGKSEGYTGMFFGRSGHTAPEPKLFMKMDHSQNSLSSPLPDFTFAVDWNDHNREDYVKIFTRVSELHGMAVNVRKLKVQHLPAGFMEKADDWAPFLERLPNVSVLELCDAHAEAAFRTLHARAVLSSTFMSELRSITVVNEDVKSIFLLVDMLDKRAEAGLPKLELELFRCSIEPPVLECLEKHQAVERVQWDGEPYVGRGDDYDFFDEWGT